VLEIPLNLSPAALEFVKMLEERMLRGLASHLSQSWALNEFGMAKDQFIRFEAMVLHIWSESGTTVENFNARRDLHRARYTDIYVRALDEGRLAIAIKALDSIARMDGFDVPQQLNVNVGAGSITNVTRDTVVKLWDKMKSLAEAKKLQLDHGSNGSNGHSVLVNEEEEDHGD
jgi:hypothetical protein